MNEMGLAMNEISLVGKEIVVKRLWKRNEIVMKMNEIGLAMNEISKYLFHSTYPIQASHFILWLGCI